MQACIPEECDFVVPSVLEKRARQVIVPFTESKATTQTIALICTGRGRRADMMCVFLYF